MAISSDLPEVLVIAHDARATGGVNNFLRVMKKNIRNRIHVTRFSNGPRKGEPSRLTASFRMLRDYVRFCALLCRKRFDVLHVNPSLDLSSTPREFIFIWLCTLLRPSTKTLVFYRGWNWGAFEKIKKSKIKKFFFLLTHKYVDRVLVLSPSFKDALCDMGIPNADVEVVSTMFEGDVLARLLKKGVPKKPQIVFLARFLMAKGGVQTIEAYSRVVKSFPEWTLVMAGDGPAYSDYERTAQQLELSNVIFTGYIGALEKMQLLAESKIFVLPTLHPEGMPNAILEAMAAGNVIVTTSVGGIADVVTNDVNGVILAGADVDEIEAALLKYVTNAELSSHVSHLNTELAWSKWEAAIVSNKIADQYFLINK